MQKTKKVINLADTGGPSVLSRNNKDLKSVTDNSFLLDPGTSLPNIFESSKTCQFEERRSHVPVSKDRKRFQLSNKDVSEEPQLMSQFSINNDQND